MLYFESILFFFITIFNDFMISFTLCYIKTRSESSSPNQHEPMQLQHIIKKLT